MGDLLPLIDCDKEETEMIKPSGGRARGRRCRAALRVSQPRDIIRAFNSLYGVKGPGGIAESPTQIQQSALQYLFVLGEEACRRGLARQEEASVMRESEPHRRGGSRQVPLVEGIQGVTAT